MREINLTKQLYDDITQRKRAEADLLKNEQRQAFLLTLSDSLRPLNEPGEIQHVAARLIAEHWHMPHTNYAQIAEQQGVVYYLVQESYSALGRNPINGHYRLADFPGVTEELLNGQTMAIADVAADPRLPDERKARQGG